MKNLKLNLKGLYGYRQSLLSRSPQPRDEREMSERRPSEERTLLALLPQRFARYAAMLIMLLTLGVGQMWGTMANFIEGSYIYIDVTNCSTWASSCTLKMNWFDSQGNSKGNYIGAEFYSTNIYRFQIPSDGIGGFQIIRLDPNDHSKQYNYSNKMYAKNRSYDSQNCLCAPSGAIADNANFTWSVYHPYAYIYDGDDSRISQVVTHNLSNASEHTYAYPFKEWVEPHEYPFGAWRGLEINKTNGVYAFYIPAGYNYTINGYKYGSGEETTNNLYATNSPTDSHHRDEGTYSWTGKGDAYYTKTAIRLKIVSNAYELYLGETTTFTIEAESPLTGLDGLEIWEDGVKVEGSPSGSGTSRTFSFTATNTGIRNISARLHFTFNGQAIYLCASDMKIRVYEKYKIKVQNTLDWDALKLYMFRNADNAIKNAAWPGTLVTEKIINDGAHDWYFVELDSKFDRFMLANSDATKQTYASGMSYDKATYEDRCYKMEGNSNTNNWTTEIACPEFYRLKSVYAAGTYYSNILMSEGKFSFYATTAGTLTLQHLVGAEWTDMSSTITRTGLTEDGVYVADFNGSNTTNNFELYSGDYYIHCDATTTNYLDHGESKSGTTGTKFIYFAPNATIFPGETFRYYWVDWFPMGQTVIASVGNDYNNNLANVLGSDSYAPDGVTIKYGGEESKFEGGNVRFGYNPQTNYFSRTIIGGSGELISIQGDRVDPNKDGSYGEVASFSDASSWVYTINANVKGKATATITTTYNDVATELATDQQLIGGNADDNTTEYTVLITYDFKTNRLLASWKPEAEFDGFDLESNLMIVRTEDGNPTVLNMVDGSDAGSDVNALTSITRIYTAIELLQDNWKNEDVTYANRPYAKRRIVTGEYIDEYYWISLPYECLVNDIFGFEGYGSDGSWVLQTYRGDLRAEKGWWAETNAWWYDLDRTDTLKANEGYVLRVTNLNGENSMTKRFAGNSGGKLYLYFPSNKNNLTIAPLTGTVKTHLDSLKCTKWHKRPKDVDPTEGANNPIYDRRAVDSNWRIIGSPSFNSTKISAPTFENIDMDADDDGIVTYEEYKNAVDQYIEEYEGATPFCLKYFYNWEVESDGISRYETKFTIADAATQEFVGTHAHLVQYAGDITWEAYDASNPLVGLKAPKRQQDASNEQTLRLVLQQGTREADVAYISRMAFGATMGYDLNMDLSKMINANSANIYTMGELYKMAGNCIPDTVTVLPVGVQLAADGNYTFAMPEGTYGTGVILVDKVANTRTNLALTDYTVTLSAGTYDERFELELSPIAQTPTDIENVQGDDVQSTNVRKVMVDGVLFIVKDGIIFDARGNRLQ